MTTATYPHTITAIYPERISYPSIFTRFMTWCNHQQHNRLLWLAIALMGHGCIITPITVVAALLSGTSLILFTLATAAMAMVLVVNLAALPTKITIPIFILSIFIDLGIIIASAAIGFNFTNVF
jgi:hypothetical protein